MREPVTTMSLGKGRRGSQASANKECRRKQALSKNARHTVFPSFPSHEGQGSTIGVREAA
jgi:hypothetical protein